MPPISDKREAILAATLALIVENGLESTPMARVAETAQVGMGTIYHYFSSKEDLVNALYREIKLKIVQATLHNHPQQAPLRERFFHMWRNLFTHYRTHPYHFLFTEQYSFSPYITPQTKAAGKEIWARTGALILEAQQQQIIKAMDVNLISPIIYGPVVVLMRNLLAGDLTLTDDMVEQAILACWNAIKL